MLYKLLRDNVESGPYTKSELMNMELLSSDFLRPDVEGSKWILANKYTELKNKVNKSSLNPENKPKPKYKITADGKMVEVSTENKTDKKNTTSPEIKDTPPTADNSGADAPPPFKRTPSALPKRKEEEEVKERTPFEYHSKSDIQNNASKAATTSVFASEPKPQIKEKKKKNAGNIVKEFVIPIAILGGIFLGWNYWNNQTGNGSKETRETLNAMLEDQEGSTDLSSLPSENVNTTPSPITTVPVQMPVADSTTTTPAPPVRKNADSIALAEARKKRTDSIALAKKTAEQEKALAAEKAKAKAEADKKAEEAKKATPTATTTAKNTENTKPATPASSTAAKKGGSVRDYVRLQLINPAKQGFVNAKIKVNNTSNTKLDVAVVRVRYLDEKSNVIKSETIQVDNIPAGRSVIVGIPDNKEAAKISYGTTMISGEDVYIMMK